MNIYKFFNFKKVNNNNKYILLLLLKIKAFQNGRHKVFSFHSMKVNNNIKNKTFPKWLLT